MDYDKPITKRQCERFSFMLRQKRKDNKLSRKSWLTNQGIQILRLKKWENLELKPNLYNVEDVVTYFKLPMNIFIGEE